MYSAMKAAVANLTKSLALELADRAIRVNCIAPDVIATPGIGDRDWPGSAGRRRRRRRVSGLGSVSLRDRDNDPRRWRELGRRGLATGRWRVTQQESPPFSKNHYL